MRETVPGCSIEYAPDGGPDQRCYRVDFSYIARALPEFKPQWNARLGVQQLYDCYKKVGLSLDDFEGPRYKRIDHVQSLLASGCLNRTLRWRNCPQHQAADGNRRKPFRHASDKARMIFTETMLKDAFVIEPERREDERGFFARTFCQLEFEAHGLNPRFVQCSIPST